MIFGADRLFQKANQPWRTVFQSKAVVNPTKAKRQCARADQQYRQKKIFGLGGFDDPTRLDTVGTNDHFLGFALVQRANTLQVRIKSSLGKIMCMAHIVTHHRFFPTYFTDSRHDLISIKILLVSTLSLKSKI